MKIQIALALSAALTLAADAMAMNGGAHPTAGPVEAVLQEPKQRDVSQYNLGQDALAIQGFDPVAYFPEGGGTPLKGLAEHELVHRGIRYHFASKKNRDLFQQRPARYEPLYGGWCAYAMATGEKVEIDPKSFHVSDEGLLLFFKSFFNDTRKKWLKDPQGLKPKADAAWAAILKPKKD